MLDEFAVSTPHQKRMQWLARMRAFENMVKSETFSDKIINGQLDILDVYHIFNWGYNQGWTLYQYRHETKLLDYSNFNVIYAKGAKRQPFDKRLVPILKKFFEERARAKKDRDAEIKRLHQMSK